MKNTILLVNAGHGGMDDKGNNMTNKLDGKQTLHMNGKTYHFGSWFYEGVFNRDIANEFIIEAQKMGYNTLAVYDQVKDTKRIERITFGNKAASGMPALWISFHANAAGSITGPQTYAEGVSVFVYKLGTETAKNADVICKAVQSVFDRWGSKRRAQLVHSNALDETTYTAMPAMLFEVGFFDNSANADLLINPKFRKEVIQAMLSEIDKLYK
jgi:N-acetylmuramoyl-L-alanine amidase